MEIERIHPARDRRWDPFVLSHPRGTLYHLSLWEEVIEKTYGYEPYYLVSSDRGGEIQGVLPLFLIESPLTGNRLVSLPFSNVCGPLGRSPAILQELIQKTLLHSHELRCDYLELRAQEDLIGIEKWGFQRSNYYHTSLVKLSNQPSKVWSDFQDRNLRTEIRKALRVGIKVRSDESGENLKEFYRLLLITRRKHGLPPQPYLFFQNLWERMSQKNLVKLLMAEYRGKIIVGLILLPFKETLIAGYIGSDDHYLPLRPHQLLYWKAMEWGCENGFQYFDFLRTASENKGLRYFKKRWGARELEIPYYYYPKPGGMTSIQEKSLKYRVSTAFWRRMPPFLNLWGSKFFYRHFG